MEADSLQNLAAEKKKGLLVVEMDELTMLSLSSVGFLSSYSISFAVVKYKSCRGTDVFYFHPRNTNATKAAKKINTNCYRSVAAASNTIKVKGNKAATLITLHYPPCH